MGLWKDRIDAEIGTVSWNKRGVYDKLQKRKRRRPLIAIPALIVASLAIMILLLTLPNEAPVTHSTERTNLLDQMKNSEIEAYYYSAFEPMDSYRYFGGIDDSYLGMKKGDKVEELKIHLSNLERENHDYQGYAIGKDVVVHFEDGSIAKLRIGSSHVVDVKTLFSYYTADNMYYHIFQGELGEGIAINKWFHAIFLILIGLNLLLLQLLKRSLKSKLLPFIFHLAILILTWSSIFNTFDGNYLLSKTMFISWFSVYVVLHVCFMVILKFKGQQLRFELYKMLLYLCALLFVWNKFFF